MVAGRREERLAETAALVRASGGEIDYHVADIAVPEACERLVAATVERFDPVDVLVNNAAITAHGKPLHEWSVAEWDQVMATNVRAAFVLSSLVLPGMRDRKRGCVVMVASDSGTNYFPRQPLYGLSKHALVDLAGYIRTDYGRDSVRAVALCPGLIDTEMGRSFDPTRPEAVLSPVAVAAWARWAISQPDNMSIAGPLILSPTWDPWWDDPARSLAK